MDIGIAWLWNYPEADVLVSGCSYVFMLPFYFNLVGDSPVYDTLLFPGDASSNHFFPQWKLVMPVA